MSKRNPENKDNHRGTWGISPVTKVKQSKKVYDRKKEKIKVKDY
ncbi:gp170 [Brochothrix phage A9]|uniref:Gp170 n=1 Tax=Brochothrix phage A9 TaxID=857312 RepID=D9J0W7_9CAUD|nr:gp170 [Brochothrix phage A9]ADJ53205.1 gp170 [Brochothrix phage A9]